MRDRLLEAWSKGQAFDHDTVGHLLSQQDEETRRLMDLIHRSNEPTVLPQEVAMELDHLGGLTFQHWKGERRTLIEPHDLNLLRIAKGSLSESERDEIQNHVTYTYRTTSA